MCSTSNTLTASCRLTQQGLHDTESCIVDAHVHTSKVLLDLGEHGEDLLVLADVTLDGDKCASLAAKLACQGLGESRSVKLFDSIILKSFDIDDKVGYWERSNLDWC